MRFIICLAFLVAACQDEGTPTPTAEENARLNEVEAMLDNEAAPLPPK